MKFTVYRSKWLRGDTTESRLYDGSRMCCLGFLGVACGISQEDMKDLCLPSEVVTEAWPKGTLDGKNDSDTIVLIVDYNDGYHSEKYREERLTALFSSIEVEVVFED